MTERHETEQEVRMPLWAHLEEFRRRLAYMLIGVAGGMAIGLAFAKPIIMFLEYPYKQAMANLNITEEPLAAFSIGAGFDLYMKTALWCGVILGGPWIIYQLWAFVSAGLRPREKRVVQFAVPFFIGLFLTGAAFFNFLVAVPAIQFLIGFDRWLDVKPVITIQNQVGFMAEMMIVFGFAFQTPLIVLVLAKVGLVSMKTLHRYRRHAITVILAFSAIFAPADVGSMIALAVSMWLLYELGVVLAYFLAFRNAPPSEDEDLDDADEEEA
jgi:sec-independent protein translocase protein TatC